MNALDFFIELNVILNLILSFIIIIWDLYFYFKMDEKEKWTKLLYAFVGLCWFVRYLLFLFDIKDFSNKNVNAPLVLLLTFTLLALALGSIIRVQKVIGFEGIKQDAYTLKYRIKAWIFKVS